MTAAADPRPCAFVPVTDVKVGDTRVVGGLITAIRTSKSGKTAWITSERIGTERISTACRICLYVTPQA